MWVVQKCLNLLRLQQRFAPKLEFGKPYNSNWWYPEQEVIDYLKSWNNKLQQDSYGNLYLINPWTPLLSAHMDTVQRSDDVEWMPRIHINKKKWTISYNDSIIWWDDKCGIAMAMQLYEKYWNKVSLIFSRQEEVGHLWASAFCKEHSDLLKQCKYCLVLDRRNAWDIIWNDNGYCSEEFEKEIHRCTEAFGYKPTSWLLSDADAYAKYINCVNLSVGYYKAHTKEEYIVVEELKNAVKAVENIIENFQWEYEIYKKPEKSSYYWNYSWKSSLYWYSYWYGYGRYGRNDREDYYLDNDYWYWKKYEEKKNSRSNSRDSYSKKQTTNTEKNNDWLSERQKIVQAFFKLLHSWDVEVKEDLVFINVNNPDEVYNIPNGTYEVMDWNEYAEYEDEIYWKDDGDLVNKEETKDEVKQEQPIG